MDESERVRRVLVCHGLSCTARGSRRLAAWLTQRLAGFEAALVEPWYCFNGCPHGPNVVLHPDCVWYEGVRLEDAEAVAVHAETGRSAGRPYGNHVPPIVRAAAFERLDEKYPPDAPAGAA